MNDKIKELADRLWRVQPSDIDAMGLKSRTEFYEHELEKFMGLIVQECFTTLTPYLDDQYIDDIESLLKSHLGVKP